MSAPPSPADPFIEGLAYLERLRNRLSDPTLIAIPPAENPSQVCHQIGLFIHPINAHLAHLLQRCQSCCLPQSHRPIAIFAAPLDSRCALDALCLLHTHPTTILIDIDRVSLPHWIRLVAHEFVHAALQQPGHGAVFIQLLEHLALPLDLPLPPNSTHPTILPIPWQSLPPYDPPPTPRTWSHLQTILPLLPYFPTPLPPSVKERNVLSDYFE